MTPPEFSVLLLAWDDADPNVAVLGGAALPPTLPLVYQLAAQQPVLAVYPHLPPAGAAPAHPAAETAPPPPVPPPPENQAIATAETLAPAAIPAAIGALETAVPMPGVLLLPGLSTATAPAGPQPFSRLVGLAELAELELNLNLASSPPLAAPAALASPAQTPKLPTSAVSRSQWPTGVNAPADAHWQTPAAPYLGAESTENPLARPYFPPPPPTPPRSVASRPVSASRPAPATRPFPNSLHSNGRPHAGDLHFDPDPELPPVRRPEAFDEPTEEIGPAEAGDISAPADDLLPDAPLLPALASVATPDSVATPALVATPAPASAAAQVSDAASAPASAPAASFASTAPIIPAAPLAPAAPVPLVPAPDGLNSRMIQYARRAAQLVRGRSDFGVIYAPSWPAWLAALEIRNSSRRPLVLYAASLAADLANPADHGYQLEMERMTMRRATLILVPDEAVRRRLQSLYQDTIGKVRVVLAADETTVRQLLAELAQTAG